VAGLTFLYVLILGLHFSLDIVEIVVIIALQTTFLLWSCIYWWGKLD